MMDKYLKPDGKQGGFTIVELIVAVGISAILGVSILSTTMSITSSNDRNIARAMAIKEVEAAVHYLNRDVQQAQKVEINGTNYWLKLSWTSWDNNTLNQVIYNIDNGVLSRQYSGSEPSTDEQVAKYIVSYSAAKPNPTPTPTTLPSEKTWTISITSEFTSGQKTATETRQIKVIPRPGF